jgi:hypothetical protein
MSTLSLSVHYWQDAQRLELEKLTECNVVFDVLCCVVRLLVVPGSIFNGFTCIRLEGCKGNLESGMIAYHLQPRSSTKHSPSMSKRWTNPSAGGGSDL